jgi:hypothetical protein
MRSYYKQRTRNKTKQDESGSKQTKTSMKVIPDALNQQIHTKKT